MSATKYKSISFSETELAIINDKAAKLNMKPASFIKQCVMDHIDLMQSASEAGDDMGILNKYFDDMKEDNRILIEESMRLLFFLLPKLADDKRSEADRNAISRLASLRKNIDRRRNEKPTKN